MSSDEPPKKDASFGRLEITSVDHVSEKIKEEEWEEIKVELEPSSARPNEENPPRSSNKEQSEERNEVNEEMPQSPTDKTYHKIKNFLSSIGFSSKSEEILNEQSEERFKKITEISDRTSTLAREISEIREVMAQYKTKIEDLTYQNKAAKVGLHGLYKKIEDGSDSSIRHLFKVFFTKPMHDNMLDYIEYFSKYIDEIKQHQNFQEEALRKTIEEKLKLQEELVIIKEANVELALRMDGKIKNLENALKMKDKELESTLKDYTEMEKYYINKIEGIGLSAGSDSISENIEKTETKKSDAAEDRF